MGKQQRYVSYLLRLWQAQSDGAWVWRASLEESHTGARRAFTDLAQLFAFIEQQTSGDAQADQPESDVES